MGSKNGIRAVAFAVTVTLVAGAGLGMAPGLSRAAAMERTVDLDGNGDGKVHLEEVLATQQAAFQRMDTDASGTVDREEYTVEKGGSLRLLDRSIFRSFDGNRDGLISAVEWDGYYTKAFEAIDQDGDRLVTIEDSGRLYPLY